MITFICYFYIAFVTYISCITLCLNVLQVIAVILNIFRTNLFKKFTAFFNKHYLRLSKIFLWECFH